MPLASAQRCTAPEHLVSGCCRLPLRMAHAALLGLPESAGACQRALLRPLPGGHAPLAPGTCSCRLAISRPRERARASPPQRAHSLDDAQVRRLGG